MKVAVHITHESVQKIGGIGAVLSGVCNLESYKGYYDKTVFYGPLFDLPSRVSKNLGKSGKVLFSSHEGYDADNYSQVFDEILNKYGVEIFYGVREVVSEFDISRHNKVDVINVGINRMKGQEVEKFKYHLWKDFGIKSHLYDDDWDYEQYLRIGVVFVEILEKLYGSETQYYHFAHEYMGVPSCLSVLLSGRRDKTIFIAHEVNTARSIVESHPGHDISFYNILKKARDSKTLEQVFGSHEHSPRSELIKRVVHFDHIFAVGDHVEAEYKFLVPSVPAEKLEVVYNGVSAKTVGIKEKRQAREHIEEYVETLFNFVPDVIFTHVTRLVVSKGIWRDIELLYWLDKIFDERNLKGFYILLSTLITVGRPSDDIITMEREYGWPVLHRQGWPDLIGAEKDVYSSLEVFNSRSKAIKGVFINQFGFNRATCGKRVPANASFEDLRVASDAELGFSIYEPFGIAQIETIPFGGIGIMSSSCGAAGFLCDKFKDAALKPFCILDFISAGKKMSVATLKNLTLHERTVMENQILSKQAKRIFKALPSNWPKREQYLLNAHKYAGQLSWESSAQSYVFNS